MARGPGERAAFIDINHGYYVAGLGLVQFPNRAWQAAKATGSRWAHKERRQRFQA